jgi:hypothetical protein
MAVYVVTGKLGGGKTLLSVKQIQLRLQAGAPVATNLDLNLVHLIGKNAKNTRVIRIPDKPSIDDLTAIGYGNKEYDEAKNGLLVLDECGTWFNSRNWNDKTRKPVNDWFLHARKLGWDVILIIQDVMLLDSQARSAIAEHTVFCRRLDRMGIPFITPLIKAITGVRLTLPRMHIARVVYGITKDDLVVDRWVDRGSSLYASYDTKQLFLDDYKHGAFSMLPPWNIYGRHSAAKTWKNTMRITKILWRRFKSPVALGAGMLIGSSMAVTAAYAINPPKPYSIDSLPLKASQTVLTHEPLPDAMFDKLEDTVITASWTIDRKSTYGLRRSFKDQWSDDVIVRDFTTDDLVNMGYNVRAVSECQVIIGNGRETKAIHCF